MARVRVENFTISIDGYGAGPNQTVENPLGVGGEELHDWLVATESWLQLHGKKGGVSGPDDEFARRAARNVGAWIMGRNMFAPSRGPWPNDEWKGWWGKNPPYHAPVFVLTHHARQPIELQGGTTFHFVTGGPAEALERAREAAGDKDIQISGGASTVQQYLRAGLIDEMHIAISPRLLGGGARLFEDVDPGALGYDVTQFVGTEKALHVVISRHAS
jgi:dihydrofolate reductase